VVRVRHGSSTDLTSSKFDFRYTTESKLKSDITPCPTSANTGFMQCSKKDRYSITSSARASIIGDMLMPSAFAVVALMINRNLVGNATGKSAGLAPLRILST
jgi:hypothetical protein